MCSNKNTVHTADESADLRIFVRVGLSEFRVIALTLEKCLNFNMFTAVQFPTHKCILGSETFKLHYIYLQ